MADARVAELLWQIGAVGIKPDELVTFKSGIRSPIYCDNRLFISRPEERSAMLKRLYALIEERGGDDWDAVAGVATAGIPFAAWVAERFKKPMVYVRAEQKDHGREHRIEGEIEQGSSVILIEDLVTTGGSALTGVTALRNAGFRCNQCFSIFDYGFAIASENFKAHHVEHHTLATMDSLIETLRQRPEIPERDLQAVLKWRREHSPSGEAAPV